MNQYGANASQMCLDDPPHRPQEETEEHIFLTGLKTNNIQFNTELF